MRRRMLHAAVMLIVSSCATSSTRGVCGAGALEAALASARPGDTVEIGRCTIHGSFVVPDGVTLRGSGAGVSAIEGDGAAATLTLETARSATAIAHLSIVSSAHTAVSVVGSGEASLTSVTIDVVRGVGVRAAGVGRITVRDATIRGPVTADMADTSSAPTPELHAVEGVVTECVGEVILERTAVSGFASAGASFDASGVRWTGGHVTENRALGIGVWGGSAELEDVEIRRTFETSSLITPVGLYVTGGATVTSHGLRVAETAGHAIVQDDSDGIHRDLDIRGGHGGGLWLVNGSSATVDGAAITDTALGGIVALAPEALTVRGATVERTRLVTRVVESVMRLGDGLHVVQPRAGTLVLEDLRLTDNSRIGALIDLGGGALAGATIDAVTVSGEGDALGFVVQNGTVPDGWDAGVTRLGATAANDAEARVGPDGAPTLLHSLAVRPLTDLPERPPGCAR